MECSDRDESDSLCIDLTHTLEVVDDLEYEDLPWNRVRTHFVTLHLQQLEISAVRILIVTDDTDKDQDQIGLWREVPARYESQIYQETVTPRSGSIITVPLLLSSDLEHVLQPLPHDYGFEKGRSGLPILHNRLYKVHPDRRTVRATFESSGAYVVIQDHESADQYFHDFHYILRIFPLELCRRARASSLPSSVIRRIGRELTADDDEPDSCARALLSCALVRKEWLEAGTLDLLWSSRAWSQFLQPAQFFGLAESMKQHMELAGRMLTMPRHVVFYGDANWRSTDYLVPSDDILSVACNLRYVDIRCFVFNYCRDRLAALTHVERLTISSFYRDHTKSVSEWDGPVRFNSLLAVISNWSKLKCLRLYEFQTLGIEVEAPGKQPASYQLRKLTLQDGSLTGSSFRRLVSNPNRVLETLTLMNVNGLDIRDIRYILDTTYLTLSHISIIKCDLDGQSPSSLPASHDITEQEELTAATTISRMAQLRNANIQGSLVSPLQLLRKPQVGGKPSGSITIQDCESGSINGQSFKEAIRHTGWESVTLYAKMGDLSQWEAQELKAIAMERKLDFDVIFYP